jgi:hypothetical protein
VEPATRRERWLSRDSKRPVSSQALAVPRIPKTWMLLMAKDLEHINRFVLLRKIR